jgi:hypothetical protein
VTYSRRLVGRLTPARTIQRDKRFPGQLSTGYMEVSRSIDAANALDKHCGRIVAYPDRTAFSGNYFRVAGNSGTIARKCP